MNIALIIIDLQNDYFKNGKMELNDIETTLNNSNILIKYAKDKVYKIFFVQHISKDKNASFFRKDSQGVKIHSSLDISSGTIIQKHYPNSFKETNLKKMLDKFNINNIIVCGAMTHMCIDTTIRAAFDLGYNITLAYDACATRDLKFKDKIISYKDVQNSFISALDGTFCKALSTSDIVNN